MNVNNDGTILIAIIAILVVSEALTFLYLKKPFNPFGFIIPGIKNLKDFSKSIKEIQKRTRELEEETAQINQNTELLKIQNAKTRRENKILRVYVKVLKNKPLNISEDDLLLIDVYNELVKDGEDYSMEEVITTVTEARKRLNFE